MADTKPITGYKVFNKDWRCLDKQYSCPGKFEEDGDVLLCSRGIHFCKQLIDCFSYYALNSTNRVARVVAYGVIDKWTKDCSFPEDSKCCTDKLEIVEELSFKETVDTLPNEFPEYMNTHLNKYSDTNTKYKVYFYYYYDWFKALQNIQSHFNEIILFEDLLNEKFKDIRKKSNENVSMALLPKVDTIKYYVGYEDGKLHDCGSFALVLSEFLDLLDICISMSDMVDAVVDTLYKKFL